MKYANILLRITNFALGTICTMLLLSCAVVTCPESTRHSKPENCVVTNAGNWFSVCEEGQYNGTWGCCQYNCRQVECEGYYGWFTECGPGGAIQVNARCDNASGRCFQQTGVSQPVVE